MERNSRPRRRVVHSEEREMIASIYHFLKAEYEFTLTYQEPNCDISHLRNITKRTAEATRVAERTVQRILREEKNLPNTSGRFKSPKRKRRKPQKKTNRNIKKDTDDGLTAYVVRSKIHELYTVEKEIPTLLTLQSILHEKLSFLGSLATLEKILKKLGYKWRKTDDNNKVLVERHEVQMQRLQYLKKITKYRSEDRPVIYTNENVGSKVVLVHAGTDTGFINNACFIYESNPLSTDSDMNMSFDDYIKWLTEMLLPNLPDHSVVVLDNTSPHNALAEKLPTIACQKLEMQRWLSAKDISFDLDLTKVELYDIIKRHKSKSVRYKIDNYIKSKGFEVLHLPAHHPELNAIESILNGVLKHYVALRSIEENCVLDTESLIQECIEKICPDVWRKSCESVIDKEREYMKYFDSEFEVLANLKDDSDDSGDTDNYSTDDSS